MINNYDKVYEEYINIIVELHNAHIAFKSRATHDSSLRIKRALAALEDHIFVHRAEIKKFREEYKKEQKRIWQEHKKDIREKKEAKDRRRELRKQRKQNEHTTRTPSSV